MKKILILLTTILPLYLLGQEIKGEIVYEEKIQLKIQIDEGEANDEIMAMMPDSRTAKKVLYFNENESLYMDQDTDAEDETISGGSGGMQFKVVIARPDNRLYKDLEGEKKIEMKDFMGKKFLIKDALNSYQWKMTQEMKEIAGYPCMKAMHSDSVATIEAWFTSEIPVFSGPGNVGRLPGMVLEMSLNNGETLITATEVKLGELDEEKLEAPSKGKEVTQAEFEEIMKIKMKEMEEEMGGNGSMHIIRRRN